MDFCHGGAFLLQSHSLHRTNAPTKPMVNRAFTSPHLW
jgi:hypothetical protein